MKNEKSNTIEIFRKYKKCNIARHMYKTLTKCLNKISNVDKQICKSGLIFKKIYEYADPQKTKIAAIIAIAEYKVMNRDYIKASNYKPKSKKCSKDKLNKKITFIKEYENTYNETKEILNVLRSISMETPVISSAIGDPIKGCNYNKTVKLAKSTYDNLKKIEK